MFPNNASHFIKGAMAQWLNFLKLLLLTVNYRSQKEEPAPYRGQESGDRNRRSKRRNIKTDCYIAYRGFDTRLNTSRYVNNNHHHHHHPMNRLYVSKIPLPLSLPQTIAPSFFPPHFWFLPINQDAFVESFHAHLKTLYIMTSAPIFLTFLGTKRKAFHDTTFSYDAQSKPPSVPSIARPSNSHQSPNSISADIASPIPIA